MSPIKNFLDALEVASIRNQCRLFMTNDTSEINPIQQLSWYLRTYKKENKNGKLKCFLFKNNGKNCGFGLIRQSFGKYWITGGLKLTQRGKGLGKILFNDIVRNVPSSDVWLEVLGSNIAAKKIYNTLGFKKFSETETNGKKVIVMKLTKEKNINEKIRL